MAHEPVEKLLAAYGDPAAVAAAVARRANTVEVPAKALTQQRRVVEMRHLQNDRREREPREIELALALRADRQGPSDGRPQPVGSGLGEERAAVLEVLEALLFRVQRPRERKEPSAPESDHRKGLRPRGDVLRTATLGVHEATASPLGEVEHDVDGGDAHPGRSPDVVGANRVRVEVIAQRIDARHEPEAGRARGAQLASCALEAQGIVGGAPGDHQRVVRDQSCAACGGEAEAPIALVDDVDDLVVVQLYPHTVSSSS